MRPTEITTKSGGADIESVQYGYDSIGNILSISDTLNTDASQTFSYDSLSRLKFAKGIYGEKSYEYNIHGNLTKKGGLNLNYALPDHPHAVSSDTNGNQYVYDTNGNMIKRKDRNLQYDSKNRLTSIWKDTDKQEEYWYDYTGLRVKKQRKDGVVTYNVGGLFELVLAPGREPHKTKYIHGIKGDLAAQITTTGAQLVTSNNPEIQYKYYAHPGITGTVYKIYLRMNMFFQDTSAYKSFFRIFLMVIFILITAVILAASIYYRLKGDVELAYYKKWLANVSPGILVIFIGVFGLFSCGTTDYADLLKGDGTTTTDVTTGGGTDTGGGSTGGGETPPSYTADVTGFPAAGTFFLHPDHIGSTKMLTDINGNVVSRFYYDPYGAVLKEQSSGQDIVRYKYTGQEEDVGTELFYYKARFYDAGVGRFISADSVVPDARQTQAFNKYMYVEGNPIKFEDFSGNKKHQNWLSRVTSAISGGKINFSYESTNLRKLGGGFVSGVFHGITGGTYGAISGAIIGAVVGTIIMGPGAGTFAGAMIGAEIGAGVGATLGVIYGGYYGYKNPDSVLKKQGWKDTYGTDYKDGKNQQTDESWNKNIWKHKRLGLLFGGPIAGFLIETNQAYGFFGGHDSIWRDIKKVRRDDYDWGDVWNEIKRETHDHFTGEHGEDTKRDILTYL